VLLALDFKPPIHPPSSRCSWSYTVLDVGLSDIYDQAPGCAFDLVAGLTPDRSAGHAGPSDARRTVRRTPDRSTCTASAGFGASCVLSRGCFQGDLLCECLLRFVGCVASQWPTLNAVLEGYVFGRDFWFRPFTPLWSLKLILQILSNVRCNYFNSSFIMVFWIIYMQI